MKIGSVSEQTGLSIHTIRYYEKQALIRPAPKDESGHRAYSKKDVEVLNWLVCMKNSGMPLSKIKAYTHAFYAKDAPACVEQLETHLRHLIDQQQKIAHYIEVTEQKIHRLKKRLT
ncbi:MerR family transcriptional regulator [Lacimicrobium sp. SS2-24]|uniref:MerR family transcriptional regulator n=1 Tax=Lacimicrobium sp. SS2-24 TaxID=2005569 RepID=UPI000B4A6870|nr:MerR family transcriptional regulator [Lacimicrobium sp. SS2-24]